MAQLVEEQPEIAPSSTTGDRSSRGITAVSLGLRLLSIGPLLILVLLAAVIGLLTPNFLKPGNLSNILAQTAVIAIVAIGQHLVILTRGIDLSVGANLALATVIGGLVFRLVDSAPLVALAMILTGRRRRRHQRLSSTSSGACPTLHHHACHPQHLPRPRARTVDRPHHHARHAGRDRDHRRRIDLGHSELILCRVRRRWHWCC